MLPNREGRFKASIAEHGVDETGPNRLATFICKFSLTQELANGEWIAVDEDLDITGYFYLEKKDGSINQITVDQLKAAFGWDGRDPLWLQDADFTGLVVQVKLEFELYDGKTKLKVRYVDAEDSDGRGVPKANDNTRKTLATRLGSKLRALAGGVPAPAPKPAGKPAAVPAKSAPKAPQATSATTAASLAPSPAKTATMQQAWQVFAKECPRGWSQESIESEWFRILETLFPGKQPDALTPQDWAIVLEQAPAQIIPM